MALETITQILAPTNAPYINGINGERRISAAILKNFYQGLVEKGGKGVDDNFVSAGDAEEATQIVVHRVLPVKMRPREQGASKNGASYSQNQHYVQTEDVGIDILQVLDDPILIPRASTDRINVDLLAEQIKIFSDRWATIYNGATTASKILATYSAKASGTEVNEQVISASDISNKLVLDKFIEGNSLLDEGDPAHGIDIFPQDTRIAVFRVSYRATLKAGGILVLGKGDEVYRILAGSGINNEGEARTADDGYVGTIDGVEVRLISNESLGHAAGFLGFPENELKKGGVFCGYIASSYANARGASTRERTKVVDEVNGQGIRLLPYIKFGAVSWYPLGNVFFTSEEWNPIGDLKSIFSSVASSLTFKLKGAGSRLYSDLSAAKLSSLATTGFVFAGCTALDDWGVTEHCKGVYYVVTPTKLETVSAFLAACKQETTPGTKDYKQGSLTVSGETINTASTVTANYWVNVLSISDDGSCVLASKQYVAA